MVGSLGWASSDLDEVRRVTLSRGSSLLASFCVSVCSRRSVVYAAVCHGSNMRLSFLNLSNACVPVSLGGQAGRPCLAVLRAPIPSRLAFGRGKESSPRCAKSARRRSRAWGCVRWVVYWYYVRRRRPCGGDVRRRLCWTRGAQPGVVDKWVASMVDWTSGKDARVFSSA